jgi:hypothetical protein
MDLSPEPFPFAFLRPEKAPTLQPTRLLPPLALRRLHGRQGDGVNDVIHQCSTGEIIHGTL